MDFGYFLLLIYFLLFFLLALTHFRQSRILSLGFFILPIIALGLGFLFGKVTITIAFLMLFIATTTSFYFTRHWQTLRIFILYALVGIYSLLFASILLFDIFNIKLFGLSDDGTGTLVGVLLSGVYIFGLRKLRKVFLEK